MQDVSYAAELAPQSEISGAPGAAPAGLVVMQHRSSASRRPLASWDISMRLSWGTDQRGLVGVATACEAWLELPELALSVHAESCAAQLMQAGFGM